MDITTLTDPITGLTFKAVDTGNALVLPLAFSNEEITFERVGNHYVIPCEYFEYKPAMSLREAAEELGVSRMRVSRMCSSGLLNSIKVNGRLVIESASVEDRKERNANRQDIDVDTDASA